MRLLVCLVLVSLAVSDVVILNLQSTESSEYNKYKADLQHIQLTNKVVFKQMVLAGGVYWCYITVSNSLIPSPPLNNTPVLIEDARKHLDKLQGMCANYRTREFIYVFCYGQSVRQLDDQITKNNMGKPLFQNFLLGQNRNSTVHQSKKVVDLEEQSYLRTAKNIGRLSPQHKHEGVNRKRSYAKVEGTSIEGVNFTYTVLWISASQFLILDGFGEELFARSFKITNLENVNLTQKVKQLLKQYTFVQANYPYMYCSKYPNIFLVVIQEYITESFAKIKKTNCSRDDIKTLNFVNWNQQLVETQSKTWPPDDQLAVGEKFLLLFSNGSNARVEVESVSPLHFGGLRKGDRDTVAKFFKIIQREGSNYTFKQSQDPVQLFMLGASDTLLGLTSSDLVEIQVLTVQGMVTLVQSDQLQYILLENNKSFRRKIYPTNYSKQIEMESKTYENFTTSSFTIHQAIWGSHDYYGRQFPRFSFSGNYAVRATSPVSVRVHNLNRYKMLLNRIEFPEQSWKVSQLYTGGDRCPPPVDQERQTYVTYKCGSAWFSIVEVSERQCIYQLIVQTRLLCPQGVTFNEREEENRETICLNEFVDLE